MSTNTLKKYTARAITSATKVKENKPASDIQGSGGVAKCEEGVVSCGAAGERPAAGVGEASLPARPKATIP
jgi:hypothetical protein